jgi:hypothetical protein
MPSSEAFLWNITSRIEPTVAQKSAAARSQAFLRDILYTGQMRERIVGDYLSGSYARDTAIRPLDDVDIIFEINPTKWASNLAGMFYKPAPATVLESFARAIRYRYPVTSVYGQRRSVRLELHHLDIDVVPAIREEANQDYIWIPDRDASNWICSSPKLHQTNATAVNRKRKSQFKPLVKLLKFWNGNLPSTARLKSFAIETMAVRVFDVCDFQSLEEGLLMFFDFLGHLSGNAKVYVWNNNFGIAFGWWTINVPDAAGTGTNVVAGLTEDNRRKFLAHGVRSRDRLIDAQRAMYSATAEGHMRQALYM